MTSTKEYIKSVVKAKYPALDLSDGSPLTELFLNPSAAMLDPIMTQLRYLLDNLGLKEPELIHPDELDAIASNFLIFRNQGTPSTGYVELFYSTPQTIIIPAGTVFSTEDGTEVRATTGATITAAMMQNNLWRFPLFSTGLIPVSLTAPSTIILQPNVIVSTEFEPEPVFVTNPTAFTVGTLTETNTELANRLLDSVLNRSLASEASIKTLVTENFPSIAQTIVVGADDERMERDLHYSGIETLQNYHLTDYRGKISVNDFYVSGSGGYYIKTSGLFDETPNFDEYPFPQSKAYWGLFYDDPTTSGIVLDLPAPDDFILQYTTSQYGNIYFLNDAYKTTINTALLLDDPFTSGALDSKWITGDTNFGYNVLRDPNEIATTVNGVRLGYTPDVNALSAAPISLSRNFISYIKDVLLLAIAVDPSRLSRINPSLVNSAFSVTNLTEIS